MFPSCNIALLLAMCTVVPCLCDRMLPDTKNYFPSALAFAPRSKNDRPARIYRKNDVSPLFSSEPIRSSSSPTPTVNGINGDTSPLLDSFFEAKPNENSQATEATAASQPTQSQQQQHQQQASLLMDKVRKLSNFAGLLCVLDCTLLPIVTVALPLLGVLNLGAGQLQAIDKLGHSLALCFVLPVGSFTTIVNYLSHRKKHISVMAVFGLVLVGLANSHFHVHQWPSLVLGSSTSLSLDWVGEVLHKIQGCGTSPWHRIANVGGCSLLLGSNYWSQKQDGCAAHHIAGGDCGAGHDHGHGGPCNH